MRPGRCDVSAKPVVPSVASRAGWYLLLMTLASCSWFTDFKDQPKIDPWEARSDSGPSRGQPQGSVSVYGSVAPEFAYARTPQALELLASLTNPVAAASASVNRGASQC